MHHVIVLDIGGQNNIVFTRRQVFAVKGFDFLVFLVLSVRSLDSHLAFPVLMHLQIYNFYR